MFLFLWIFSGWIRGSYDVEIGISRYLESSRFESFTEIGYSFLVEFGHKLELSYRMHFVIWSLFEVTILVWFINKWCIKPPIVYAMFLLYPMIFYFQYVRNIAAFSIVLIGFSCLIEEKKNMVNIYMRYAYWGLQQYTSTLYILRRICCCLQLERK
ncbi:EpsG family protein [Butyrivibrio fibrisolvens]|uniref:EpsG family protein n=1 Tax=Butyrivibrio fibrisolvens TaxID=831 RepID=UPI003B50F934